MYKSNYEISYLSKDKIILVTLYVRDPALSEKIDQEIRQYVGADKSTVLPISYTFPSDSFVQDDGGGGGIADDGNRGD